MTLLKLLEDSALAYSGKVYNCHVGFITQNVEKAVEKAEENPLFVCVEGTKFDSHKRVEKLYREGVRSFVVEDKWVRSSLFPGASFICVSNTRIAAALLSRAFYGFPDKKMKLVGITGTKGKTTITYMLGSIFKEAGKSYGIIGTNGISYGETHIETINSTPGAIELFKNLRDMRNSGVEYVFLEVTSQALMQNRVFGISFDVAAFANLFYDHIGEYEHPDFSHYRECKGLLFYSCKSAVLNLDSVEFSYFKNICTRCGVEYITYSVKDKDAHIHEIGAELQLPGAFNLENALCATGISKILGVDEESIWKGLSIARADGRCERVENPCGVNIIIDYAHNKESLENILTALRAECGGTLYCVFGAGGDRSKLRRSGMGEAASTLADYCIVTSDNPRSEEPESIIADIVSGMGENTEKYMVIPDRRTAICHALSLAAAGDTVLLAGKGAQTFEEIKGVRYHLDEREVIAQYYEII